MRHIGPSSNRTCSALAAPMICDDGTPRAPHRPLFHHSHGGTGRRPPPPPSLSAHFLLPSLTRPSPYPPAHISGTTSTTLVWRVHDSSSPRKVFSHLYGGSAQCGSPRFSGSVLLIGARPMLIRSQSGSRLLVHSATHTRRSHHTRHSPSHRVSNTGITVHSASSGLSASTTHRTQGGP